MSISVPIRFSFVDQSSPHRLENFDEDIPTSPDVTSSRLRHLILSQIFAINFFLGGGTPSPLGDGLGSLGQSVSRVKI